MRASREIIGLRIISISDGTQVGYVKDYVLNPQGGSLEFIIVDQPSDLFGAKVIAFADILGIGEFAVTIPDSKVIQDVAQNLIVQDLLKTNVSVIGTKVLTKKGSLVGEVEEIVFDEETGKVASCIFLDSKGEKHQVSAERIITYGKELLVIEGLGVKQEEISLNPSVSIPIQSSTEVTPLVTVEEQTTGDSTGFNLFEQRQLQYFVGKTVDKDIFLDNGELLAAGQPMTDETIGKITKRSTLMEVTSYLSKN